MNGTLSNETQLNGNSGARDFFRIVGGMLALALIGFGGFWSAKLFFMIKKALEVPSETALFVKSWRAILNLETLNITVGQTAINIDAQTVPLIILWAGAFLLASITIGLVKAGISLLSAMTLDVESVKKIVSSALNRSNPSNPSGPA